MRFRYILFLGLFFPHLIGCKTKEDRITKSIGPDSTTVNKEIRYYEDSSVRGSRQTPFLTNLARYMNLPMINHGVNGLYMRIWLWDPMGKYVINISDSSGNDYCSVVQLHSRTDQYGDFIIIDKEWTGLRPKSGWLTFFDTLRALQILDLK